MQDTNPDVIDRERFLDAAKLGLSLCETVLDSPEFSRKAAFELAWAWHSLCCFCASGKQTAVPFSADALDWIDDRFLRFDPRLPASQWKSDLQEYFAAASPGFFHPAGAPFDDARLRRHVSMLRRTLLRAASINEKERHPYRRWAKRAALMLVLFGAAGLLWQHYGPEPRGPWQAAYYDNPQLLGEPARTGQAGDIDFDWTYTGPFLDFPSGDYSVRWTTRLTVKTPTPMVFELASDDGSRLFVDGQLLIDQWKAQPFAPRTAAVTLQPGTHPLIVEYFQIGASAQIRLRADWGNGMQPLPPEMLGFGEKKEAKAK